MTNRFWLYYSAALVFWGVFMYLTANILLEVTR